MSRRSEASRQIVTANDLIDGDVVFLDLNGCWTRDIAAAAVAASGPEADALLGAAETQEDKVVGPYLADVLTGPDGAPSPTHYRERIRLAGPTNRTDLGRQAAAPTVRRNGDIHVSL